MSPEDKGLDVPNDDKANGEADDMASLPAWAQKLINTLRKGEGDYRMKAKAAEEKAAADAERLQKEALAKQGEFEKLYQQTTAELEAERAYRKRAATLEAKITATNEARIARIPEGMRSVIPGDYPPEKLSEWLDANEALLTKSPPPPRDGGRTGDNGHTDNPKLTDIELQMAKMAGLTPAEYAKNKLTTAVREVELGKQ